MVGTSVFDHELGAKAEARMRAALHQVFGKRKPISYEVEARAVAVFQPEPVDHLL